jgi:hypothetical protein
MSRKYGLPSQCSTRFFLCSPNSNHREPPRLARKPCSALRGTRAHFHGHMLPNTCARLHRLGFQPRRRVVDLCRTDKVRKLVIQNRLAPIGTGEAIHMGLRTCGSSCAVPGNFIFRRATPLIPGIKQPSPINQSDCAAVFFSAQR